MGNSKADKRQKKPDTYDLAKDIGIPVFTPTEFRRHLEDCYAVRRPVLVMGRPGCGKTEIINDFAKDNDLLNVTVRLNGHEPADFGLPKIYTDANGVPRHCWTVPDFFVSDKEDIPKGYKGVLGFFDELGQAYPQMQNRIREWVNEHTLNRQNMHKDVFTVLASNFAADKAATYPIPKHLLNTVSVVALAPSMDDSLRYISERDIHEDIGGFIRWKQGEMLDSFDPDATQNCTSRSLCNLSPFIRQGSTSLALFQSMIGEGWAAEFKAYIDCKKECPTVEEIEKDPVGTPVPDEDRTDLLCATAAMLGRALNPKNGDKIIRYLTRMTSEYCVFALRDAFRRDANAMKRIEAFNVWIRKHGDVLS